MAAPGPGRQAEPAGRAADRRRHGRGRRRSRSTRRGRGRAGRGAARRPADDRDGAGAASVLPLATGLPASPGIASGPIVTTPEAAVAAADGGRAADPRPRRDVARRRPRDGPGGRHPDLARRARQPCRGRGPRLGDPGGGRRGRGRGRRRPVVDRRADVLDAGDVITIDGSDRRGLRRGDRRARPRSCRRPRRCSRGRAELGIPIRAGRRGRGPAAGSPRRDRGDARATPDDASARIAIKGFAPLDGVADAVLATPDDRRPILDQLVVEGLVATVAGAYRLTEAGTTRAGMLLAAEQAAWGLDRPRCRARRVPRPRPSGEGRSSPPGSSATPTARSSTTTPTRPTTRRPGPARRRSTPRRWPGSPRSRRPRCRASPTTAPGSGEPSSRPGRRRAVRGVTAGRQLPRHLVRAPRGPHPPRRPNPRGRGRRRPRLGPRPATRIRAMRRRVINARQICRRSRWHRLDSGEGYAGMRSTCSARTCERGTAALDSEHDGLLLSVKSSERFYDELTEVICRGTSGARFRALPTGDCNRPDRTSDDPGWTSHSMADVELDASRPRVAVVAPIRGCSGRVSRQSQRRRPRVTSAPGIQACRARFAGSGDVGGQLSDTRATGSGFDTWVSSGTGTKIAKGVDAIGEA